MKEKTLPAFESARAPLQSQTNPLDRILVVDDDDDIRRINATALTNSDYEVDVAEDGAVAWEILQRNSYDLVVTDNSMPMVSGVELLKKLRSARMVIPVIMATGTVPALEIAENPAIQPTATLLKPYTAAELLRMVKKTLREAEYTAASSQPIMFRDGKENPILPAGEPAGAPRHHSMNAPHRILVVDEDSDLRLLYADALAGPGYDVDVAEDGVAGWEALQANQYSLLITEHDLPKLSGVELVEKLRSARMALPVVMAAGRLPAQELARYPSLQLAATLSKPFAFAALLDTVKNVLDATAGDRDPVAPPPNWQSQPSTDVLRLG